jgi:hypothetical protein
MINFILEYQLYAALTFFVCRDSPDFADFPDKFSVHPDNRGIGSFMEKL